MIKESSARGLFLAAIALFFAGGALRYPIGDLSHAGPGLFPLLISGPLLILAALIIIRSRLQPSSILDFNVKNIAIITAALCSFVVAAKYLSTLMGVVLLVFIAGLAASSYSWVRNVKIALGLVAVAFIFQRFLGLNLRLI